jgi:hypothetical protein
VSQPHLQPFPPQLPLRLLRPLQLEHVAVAEQDREATAAVEATVECAGKTWWRQLMDAPSKWRQAWVQELSGNRNSEERRGDHHCESPVVGPTLPLGATSLRQTSTTATLTPARSLPSQCCSNDTSARKNSGRAEKFRHNRLFSHACVAGVLRFTPFNTQPVGSKTALIVGDTFSQQKIKILAQGAWIPHSRRPSSV